jgi:intracellular sulfur oxidation DsrE/DsrF family protein
VILFKPIQKILNSLVYLQAIPPPSVKNLIHIKRLFKMRKNYLFAFILLCTLKITAQKTINPVIKNGGGIYEVPDAVPMADLEMKYKMVYEISSNVERMDTIHPSLDKMARLINLHRQAGIKAENLDLAIFIHQSATGIILTDEAHQKKYKVVNPNTKIINELAENGVKIYVCGQSLFKRKLYNEPRNANIKVVSSAILGISTLLSKGYVMMP